MSAKIRNAAKILSPFRPIPLKCARNAPGELRKRPERGPGVARAKTAGTVRRASRPRVTADSSLIRVGAAACGRTFVKATSGPLFGQNPEELRVWNDFICRASVHLEVHMTKCFLAFALSVPTTEPPPMRNQHEVI